MMVSVNPIYGENYKAGQTFFTNDNRIVSKGISWFTSKKDEFKATHCGICIGPGYGVEMQWNGFKYVDLMEKYFIPNNRQIVFKEPITLDIIGFDPVMHQINIMLESGIKYDFLEIFGQFLTENHIIGELLTPFAKEKIRSIFNSKQKYLCSEIVAHIYIRAGLMPNTINLFCNPQELFSSNVYKTWKFFA